MDKTLNNLKNDNLKTVDKAEIAKFSALSDQWWEENGKFKPLHLFNPIRIAYIKQVVANHKFSSILPNHTLPNHTLPNQISPNQTLPSDISPSDTLKDNYIKNHPLITTSPDFSQLSLLDIGCGGGLLAEPMARLGFNVTAIDASEKNIKTAAIHAEKMSLNIDYRCMAAEELARSNNRYDVILAMEIIEHVANANDFIKACAQLLKPNGILFIATLNRTLKSYLTAIIGAEYILRLLPRNTHDWKKFLKPAEIGTFLAQNQLKLTHIQGFSLNILNNKWKKTNDPSVNYAITATKI